MGPDYLRTASYVMSPHGRAKYERMQRELLIRLRARSEAARTKRILAERRKKYYEDQRRKKMERQRRQILAAREKKRAADEARKVARLAADQAAKKAQEITRARAAVQRAASPVASYKTPSARGGLVTATGPAPAPRPATFVMY